LFLPVRVVLFIVGIGVLCFHVGLLGTRDKEDYAIAWQDLKDYLKGEW